MTDLTVTLAQINPVIGDLAANAALIRKHWHESKSDLIVFPELALTGYMPEDLLLKPSYLDAVEKTLAQIVEESRDHKTVLVLPTPLRENGKLYNALHVISDGKILHTVRKHHLPNYGVFDELRYFTSGDYSDPITIKGKKIGFLICEDTWFPDVAAHLKSKGAEILISTNASPFATNKWERRLAVVQARVEETGLPLLYLNPTCGYDDLVFDGGSFAMDANGTITQQAKFFESDALIYNPSNPPPALRGEDKGGGGISARSYHAATLAMRDYVTKNNFKGVLIGMSGGIDSALCAAIATDALGKDKVRCVMMPSPFTSKESMEDAAECSKRLDVSYDIIPIADAMGAFENTIPALNGIAHENMQARCRGVILMSLSNQNGYLVLSTGNKSELAVGYATLYGDMVGGFAPIKDIYKTQIYDIAKWRNDQSAVIPERILTKAPTAELKPNQTDQDSLPPYPILDGILQCFIERDLGIEETVEEGFDANTVKRVWTLLHNAEYKRRQGAVGPKISPRAFTRERRYPLLVKS
jgi:NAD+ synthase